MLSATKRESPGGAALVSIGLRRALLILAVGLVFVVMAAGTAGQVYSVTYHAGWNLAGASEGARYAGADGALYTLQPGDDGYEALPAGSPAVEGRGYWVYFP